MGESEDFRLLKIEIGRSFLSSVTFFLISVGLFKICGTF